MKSYGGKGTENFISTKKGMFFFEKLTFFNFLLHFQLKQKDSVSIPSA